jgi:hypothetical protein
MTAHNQWQSTTRSIAYWTTRVFQCDESRTKNSCSHIELAYERRLSDESSYESSLVESSRVESYVTTDGHSASLSWHKAPIWDLRPDNYYGQTVEGLLMWSPLSDERSGLLFTIAAGPRQRSHSRVWVPWDSWSYFTVSDLRLPFSSPPTTRRVTVEVFDPASTRATQSLFTCTSCCIYMYTVLTERYVGLALIEGGVGRTLHIVHDFLDSTLLLVYKLNMYRLKK